MGSRTAPKTLIIAALFLVSVTLLPVGGQSDTTGYEGLDVLFMVNQSVTLAGISGNTPDSTGERFSGIQTAIDWLGVTRAQQAMLGVDFDIRISGIYYGGVYTQNGLNIRNEEQALQHVLDWSRIAPDDLDAWREQRTELVGAFAESSFTDASLGLRDHLYAFEEGFALFERESSRRQIVILITDGKPCDVAYDNGSDPNCNINNPAHQQYMLEMEASVQRFAAPNRSLHVLFLNNTDDQWSRYDDMWTNIGSSGSAQVLPNGSTLDEKIHDILANVIRDDFAVPFDSTVSEVVNLPRGAGLSVTSGAVQLDVPAYQEVMYVTLFKSLIGTQLVAEANSTPLNSSLLLDSGDYTAIYRIANPPPGAVELSTQVNQNGSAVADPNASLRIDFYPADFEFELQTINPRQFLAARFDLSTLTSQDQIIPIYSDQQYQLDAAIHLQPPRGESITLPLAIDSNAQVYTASFTPSESGRYIASVSARLENEVVYESQPLEFMVSETITRVEGIQQRSLEDIEQSYQLQVVNGGNPVPELTVERWIVTFIPEDQMCSLVDVESPVQPTGVLRYSDFTPNPEVPNVQMRFTPDTPGTYRICMNIRVLNALTREPEVVYNQEVARTTIIPVEGLALLMTRPLTLPSRQYAQDRVIEQPEKSTIWLPIFQDIPLLGGLVESFPFLAVLQRPYWEINEIPLEFTVVHREDVANLTVNEVGIRYDIPDGTDLNSYLTLTIINDETEQQVAWDAQLQVTANPAVWSVTLSSLPIGTYTIRVTVPSQPIGDTNRAFLPDDDEFTQTLVILSNPDEYLYTGLYVFLSAVSTAGLIYSLIVIPVRRRARRLYGEFLIMQHDNNAGSVTTIAKFSLAEGKRPATNKKLSIKHAALINDAQLLDLQVENAGKETLKVSYLIGGATKQVSLKLNTETEFAVSQETPGIAYRFRWEP